jgi:type I restriction enzyme, R subunit
MSNFTFLKTHWPELYETAREAEQNVNSAPRTSCFYARRSLERAVKWLYANDSTSSNSIRQPGRPDPRTYLSGQSGTVPLPQYSNHPKDRQPGRT